MAVTTPGATSRRPLSAGKEAPPAPPVPPELPKKSERTIRRQSLTSAIQPLLVGGAGAAAAAGPPLLTMPRTSLGRGTAAQQYRSGKMRRLEAGAAASGAWCERTEDEEAKLRAILMRMRQDEVGYLDCLTLVLQGYQNHVQPAGEILSRVEMDAIFGNVQQLQLLHCKLLARLETHLANHREDARAHPLVPAILGDLHELLPTMSSAYADYVQQHSLQIATLERCRQEVPRFAKLLRAAYEQSAQATSSPAQSEGKQPRNGELAELLRLPVNQMARYNEMLHTLLSRTRQEDPSHRQLSAMCRTVEAVKREVDELKRRARLDIRAYELATRVSGLGADAADASKGSGLARVFGSQKPRHHSLLDLPATSSEEPTVSALLPPGRLFLTQWVVPLSTAPLDASRPAAPDAGAAPAAKAQQSARKLRHFFLFSDVLLVCKAKDGSDKMQAMMWLDLGKLYVNSSFLSKHQSGKLSMGFAAYAGDSDSGSGDDMVLAAGAPGRDFPLELVYVNNNPTAIAQQQASQPAPAGTTSVAQRLGLLSARRRAAAAAAAPQSEQNNNKPVVEGMVLHFDRPSERREVFDALAVASKALKLRRDLPHTPVAAERPRSLCAA